ncbi:MAG: aspartate kinase [Flavobacteriaceae bacterium]|nr:MAG: aspartate kinase [Flavobacteriaceae bacterium]
MKTVQKIVNDLLKESPFIQDGLSEGYINLSALASKFQPYIEKISRKEIQKGSIVMAIKRHDNALGSQMHERKIFNYISNLGDTIVRSNLVEYTFKNSDSMLDRQQELLVVLKEHTEAFHYTAKGMYETNIISNSFMSNDIERIYKDETEISNVKNLTSLTMRFPNDVLCVSGIFYFIFKKLANENVNIIELISTSNEFTIVIHKKDTGTAFQVLEDLKK